MTPTRALAERIAGTQYADIPAPARTVAKQALLDFIGVTMAGIDEPLARMLRDQVIRHGAPCIEVSQDIADLDPEVG